MRYGQFSRHARHDDCDRHRIPEQHISKLLTAEHMTFIITATGLTLKAPLIWLPACLLPLDSFSKMMMLISKVAMARPVISGVQWPCDANILVHDKRANTAFLCIFYASNGRRCQCHDTAADISLAATAHASGQPHHASKSRLLLH